MSLQRRQLKDSQECRKEGGEPGEWEVLEVRFEYFTGKVVTCAENCWCQKREELKLLIGFNHMEVVFMGSYINRKRGNGKKEGAARINLRGREKRDFSWRGRERKSH